MNKPNAYSLFVSDHARNKGSNVNRVALYRELDQAWRNLPELEKERYKSRAKAIKEDWQKRDSFSGGSGQTVQQPNPSTEQAEKSDIKGTVGPLTSPDNVRNSKRPHEDDKALVTVKKNCSQFPFHLERRPANPIEYLDNHLLKVRQMCQGIIREKLGKKLITSPLFSCSINVLCKIAKSRDPVIFVPLEISIIPYSLKHGMLTSPYHVLIDAGPVPTNHYNSSIDHSAHHKITFPTKDPNYPSEARNDYHNIYNELIKFTDRGERTILAFSYDHAIQITGSLEWLYKKATEAGCKVPRTTTWTVLPITEYITCMYNSVYQNLLGSTMPKFALLYYMEMLLDVSSLDFNAAIMCEYHRKPEYVTKWCTRNCASRMFQNLEPILDEIFKMLEHYMTNTSTVPQEQTTNNQSQTSNVILAIEASTTDTSCLN